MRKANRRKINALLKQHEMVLIRNYKLSKYSRNHYRHGGCVAEATDYTLSRKGILISICPNLAAVEDFLTTYSRSNSRTRQEEREMSECEPSCEIHARYSRGCSECHSAEMTAFRATVAEALAALKASIPHDPIDRQQVLNYIDTTIAALNLTHKEAQ